MLNNNLKNKTGDVDPFNKKKLAEEAKRDQARIQEVQRQQERNKLQLEIDNRKREIDKLSLDLRTKENLLIEAKRKSDEAKKTAFLFEGKIKQQKGSVDYLEQKVSAQEGREASAEAELERATAESNSL